MDGMGTEHTIKLTDGGPWGFRLSGGADYGCPLQVAKVRVNSKAYYAGLEEGDIITSVNDDSDVRLSTHANAMQIIESGGDNITISVIRGAPSLETVYRTFVESSRTASILSQNQPHGLLQSAATASLVRVREPSISRAHVSLSREASPSRSLHVITRSASRDNISGYGSQAAQYGGLLTVNTTPPQQRSASYKSFQTEVDSGKLLIGKPERSALPPTSPRIAVHRATSLPRATPGTTITHQNIPLSGSVTDLRQLRTTTSTSEHQTPEPRQEPRPFSFGQRSENPVVVPIKPFEMPKSQSEMIEFRVRNVNAPKQVWQPANTGYQLPNRDAFGNMVDCPPNPYTNTRASDTRGDEDHQKQPANFYWELMKHQPDHMPGYVDPLIVDDTQGDFGGNPIIKPERDLYADSNFYKTKDSLYPTIPEQMKLCRMISGILDAPDAMRSRGGKMYLQRKNSTDQYAKESMGRKVEKPYDGLDAESIRPYDTFHHWSSAMKENLTVDELERLEHNTEHISKHDLLPPVVAFDINSALTSSKNHGKGVEIFRRNQERAAEFTVDETNRQRYAHPSRLDTQVEQYNEYLKSYKSPWTAAWEGNLERAFAAVDVCAAQSVRDEPELRRDENVHALQYNHQQATFGVKYKNIAPVRAPRGPAGSESRPQTMRQLSSSMSSLDQVGRPEPRLAKMIAPREDERATFDTYTYKWCMPSYYGKDLMSASVDERMALSQLGNAGWYRRPTDNFMHPMSYSADGGMLGNVTLRRPKDFVKPKVPLQSGDFNYSVGDSLSEYGPPPSLRRPSDYYGPSMASPHGSYQYGGSGMTTPVPSAGVSAY